MWSEKLKCFSRMKVNEVLSGMKGLGPLRRWEVGFKHERAQ